MTLFVLSVTSPVYRDISFSLCSFPRYLRVLVSFPRNVIPPSSSSVAFPRTPFSSLPRPSQPYFTGLITLNLLLAFGAFFSPNVFSSPVGFLEPEPFLTDARPAQTFGRFFRTFLFHRLFRRFSAIFFFFPFYESSSNLFLNTGV